MAQDFGDDVGDMLLRNITRYSEKAIGLILNEYFKSAIRDWQQAKLEEEGMSKEEAAIKAEVMASREHICMPFGNSTDAAYFAQVVRENGTYAAAMTDDNGNGYVQFAKDDLQKVRECTVQFSEVMTNLKCGEISELIANGKPVTQDVFKSLKPIKNLPDLPNVDGIELNLRDVTLIPVAIRFTDTPDKVEVRTFSEQDTADLDMDSEVFFSGYTHDELTDMVGKATGEDFIVESVGEPYQVKARIIEQESRAADFPEQTYDDRVNDTYNHTEGIRDKVLNAREQCRDFDDFKELLAKEDIGVTEGKNGELMFYEARRDENDEILDRGPNKDGLMDWAVGAKTLRDRYKCDVTHDWFEKNTPKEPTANETAHEVVPPQKDLNLICNAVRGDLKEHGIETYDRPDGKMGFLVDVKHKQDVIKAVETRFPGHAPEELGIEFFDHGPSHGASLENVKDSREPQVTDGSLDMNGSTPDINQGIESHDGMDTMVNTLRIEREQNGTEVSPSMVREQSDRSREKYDLNSQAKECRAASKQLSQTNDYPDRDISDKFQQER